MRTIMAVAGIACISVACQPRPTPDAVGNQAVSFGLSKFTEYEVPTRGSDPFVITSGPDGALWFTEQYANKIGRVTIGGSFTEFSIPTANSQPSAITSGPDGALWFTEERGNKVGRVATTGSITEFAIPTEGSSPSDIASGPDGALWFTEQSGKIGRITTAGVFREFPIPETFSQSPGAPKRARPGTLGITNGPGGTLWFTITAPATKIGRITTDGSITAFDVPSVAVGPGGIAAGPDTALWFTDISVSRVGRITTAGSSTVFAIPTPDSFPIRITHGPDGALWFVEFNTNKIGRITTGGSVDEFAIPTPSSSPNSITAGPDGALWFTEMTGNKIGRLGPASQATLKGADPDAVKPGTVTSLRQGGDGPNNAAARDSQLNQRTPMIAIFSLTKGPEGSGISGAHFTLHEGELLSKMYGREYTHVTLKVQLPGDFEKQPSAERVRLLSEALSNQCSYKTNLDLLQEHEAKLTMKTSTGANVDYRQIRVK